MMNKAKRSGGLLLVPVLAALLLLLPLNAAADYSCTATLPDVTVACDGSSETFEVTLAAVDGAPLPDTTDMKLAAGESGSFGDVTYTEPGDYVYKVQQVCGNAAYHTYDDTVYTMTVRVTNATDDAGNTTLKSEIWAVADDAKDEGKSAALAFANTYAPPTPTPAPTAAPTGGSEEAAPTATPAPSAWAIPQTSDAFPILAVLAVLVIAVVGFGYTVYRKKKQDAGNDAGKAE